MSALDKTITIRGVGLVFSLRSLLQMLCAAANLDRATCNLITTRPDEACKTLVARGDTWLHDRIEEALDKLVGQVLEGVDCQAKDWKDVVIGSLDVSFSDNGIAVEIDVGEIVQSVICMIARKAVGMAFEPVINTAVRELKAACTKLSSGGGSGSGSSSTTQPATNYDFSKSALLTSELVRIDRKHLIAIGAKRGVARTSTSKWPWFLAGVAILGGAMWFTRRRRR